MPLLSCCPPTSTLTCPICVVRTGPTSHSRWISFTFQLHIPPQMLTSCLKNVIYRQTPDLNPPLPPSSLLLCFPHSGGRTGRKILKFMDKITKSKYFQKATENEFIRKKFEEMSNTPLLLTVEVQELSGTLVINIPPPPTDRIW